VNFNLAWPRAVLLRFAATQTIPADCYFTCAANQEYLKLGFDSDWDWPLLA
jgi:hypothetical protein